MALSGQQAEDAIEVSLTLKALANSSPGLQQPWESSSNLCRSRTLKEFAKAPAHRWPTLSALQFVNTQVPGLQQPWAEIGERFQRYRMVVHHPGP